MKFVFSFSTPRKQPFFAEIFKIQGGLGPPLPALPTPMTVAILKNLASALDSLCMSVKIAMCAKNTQYIVFVSNQVTDVANQKIHLYRLEKQILDRIVLFLLNLGRRCFNALLSCCASEIKQKCLKVVFTSKRCANSFNLLLQPI